MGQVDVAAEATLHGVLMDVHGIGILLLGESGTGKSECALDLVSRGHGLVADDVVELWLDDGGWVNGRGPARIRHHMEIRGLGILNIRELFGVTAIRDRKRIELVIRLEVWQADAEYDRLGLDEPTWPILGVNLPLLRFPISAGRNMAILVEVAARNHLLKRMGIHSARALTAQGTADPE